MTSKLKELKETGEDIKAVFRLSGMTEACRQELKTWLEAETSDYIHDAKPDFKYIEADKPLFISVNEYNAISIIFKGLDTGWHSAGIAEYCRGCNKVRFMYYTKPKTDNLEEFLNETFKAI